MKMKWTVLALSVLLIGGCNSNGSSSSKDTLYRQIFVPDIQTSPASGNKLTTGEPNVITKEFNPGDYSLVTKSRDFFEYYDPKLGEGYGIEAFSVRVESTPTVDKYVYILGRIDYSDRLGVTPSQLPNGPMTYTGAIEYYDPANDPNLENLQDDGKFKITRTFNGTGDNSIDLDWNGDGTYDVRTEIEIPDDEGTKLVDFTFSEKDLIGHGTFHQSWQNVYGLFKSPNYAGGFKGSCQTNCTP